MWAPEGLISGYLALDGDNSVASCSLREAILLFGLTAILCLFVCFASISEKKKENETQAGVLLASKQTNTNEFELAIVQQDLDSRIHQVNAQ